MGLVASDFRRSGAPTAADGRLGFYRLETLVHYEEGRPADPDGDGGRVLDSEWAYIDVAPPTVFDGLEAFARRYAQRMGKEVWTDVPTGWNSWGGHGAGGYGQTIDEQLLLDNMDAAVTDFLPQRMDWFLIDDGWQTAHGDWWPRTDNFPDHGQQNSLEWLADRVRERGMTPGIWIAPYTGYLDMHAHPEWRAQVNPLLPVYPHSGRPLDLFRREYPETWVLPAERDGRTWSVVGLFNWGLNKDIGAEDWEAEQPRTVGLSLAAMGRDPAQRHLVFDAWDHTWEWTEADRVERTLEPRTEAVLIVRAEPADPAVVFTTFHLLGGAVEVHDEAWDAAAGTLTAAVDTVPGEAQTVWVAAAGRTPKTVAVTPAEAVTHEVADGLLAVRFAPQGTNVELRIDWD